MLNSNVESPESASSSSYYTIEDKESQELGGSSLPLSTAHFDQLFRGSGITRDVIAKRGYRSVSDRHELCSLGFQSDQVRPGLLIPVWTTGGYVAFHALRPDVPRRDDNDKPIKYDEPPGTRMVIDVHPRVRSQLSDPAIPLFITEGIKKGDALVSRGLCAVALLGVWNWRGTNDQGGKTVLSDFDEIALNDRLIYLVFDSDVMTKREVHQALERLAEVLKRRAAKVKFIYLSLVLQRDFVTSHPVAPGCAYDGTDKRHGSAAVYTGHAPRPREV